MKNKILAVAILGALAGTTQAHADQTAPLVPLKAMATDQNGEALGSGSNAVMLYDNSSTIMHIYGIVEATISKANNQKAGGGTTAGFQTAWFSGNRLGFDADHALAFGDEIGLPGLKVISKLETEFELPTGNMDTAGVLFNRDAWMGLYSDDLGKITLGRQNSLTRDFTSTWGDPYGSASVILKEGGYSNVNNFKQFIYYSGGATGTRLSSAVEWKKKFDAHWVVGLGYGFGSKGAGGGGSGGSVPGDFTNGTTQEASVAYNGLELGAAKLNVNGSFNRANVADLIHQSELFGGNVTIGPIRFNTGVVHYTAQQGTNNSMGSRTDNSWTTSISFMPEGRMKYDLGYQQMKGKHAGFGGSGNTLNPFGDTSSVTTVADGGKNTLYGSIVFRADKQTDFYIAADYFTVKQNWVVGDAQGNGNHFGIGKPSSSEFETAIGIRYKF
jgi:predicted porin